MKLTFIVLMKFVIGILKMIENYILVDGVDFVVCQDDFKSTSATNTSIIGSDQNLCIDGKNFIKVKLLQCELSDVKYLVDIENKQAWFFDY